MEKTLIIIKPDAVQRCLIGEITRRLEQKGLKLVACKMSQLDADTLKIHYGHLTDKPFYPRLEEFMMSSPVIMQIWQGYEAVETVRKFCGTTNSREAEPGSIRGDLSMSFGSNTIHASDTKENADAEIERFFTNKEVFDYKKIIEEVSYSDDEK